jgi:hypothetical protein
MLAYCMDVSLTLLWNNATTSVIKTSWRSKRKHLSTEL